MFFREKKTKTTPVLQLVENRRDSRGKVRQHIVASLGGCAVPDDCRKAVALEVSQRMAGYVRLLPEDPRVVHWTKVAIDRVAREGKLPRCTCSEVADPTAQGAPEPVRVDEIEHEEGTELGPCLVLLKAWEALGIDAVLREHGFSLQQRQTAKVSVFGRLRGAGSENDLLAWVQTTALSELLGVQAAAWGEDRFYRISDRLLRVRDSLEDHLRERERSLFRLERTILLYDLTNSYFEGTAKRNPLARRSANSKENRTDRPLLSVGVVLDADGFLITHKVFRGNISDCRTLVAAVERLRRVAAPDAVPTVVLDGGIATDENLRFLRRKGYGYVVNGKRQTRAEFAEDFVRKDCFTKVSGRDGKVKTPVFVRRILNAGETVVLCRSDGRRDKEDAIVDGAERKLVEGLEKLEARLHRRDPRLKLDEGPALVDRAVGRLTSRTTRASKHYTISYDHETRSLDWCRREQDWKSARDLHGCYHLRSSLDLTDEQIWKLYITLTRVEGAFKLMKSDLGLHPFRHHTEKRCRGHVWVTILAYHLLRWLEHTMELSGYEATWQALERRLETHRYATVIVPTAEGLIHHTRKPGRPNETQRLVYSLLGIDCKALPVRKRTYRSK